MARSRSEIRAAMRRGEISTAQARAEARPTAAPKKLIGDAFSASASFSPNASGGSTFSRSMTQGQDSASLTRDFDKPLTGRAARVATSTTGQELNRQIQDQRRNRATPGAAIDAPRGRGEQPKVSTFQQETIQAAPQRNIFGETVGAFQPQIQLAEAGIAKAQSDFQTAQRESETELSRLRGAPAVSFDTTEKGKRLLRSQAVQSKDFGFQQALAGTVRGSRAGEKQVVLADMQAAQQEAVQGEINARRRLQIEQAEGASRARLGELAKRLDLSISQRLDLEGQIQEQAFSAIEKEQDREFQFSKIQFQESLDIAKLNLKFENDVSLELIKAELDPQEISDIDSTTSKLLGQVIRKDGSFVLDRNGDVLTVPQDVELRSKTAPSIALPQGTKYQTALGATGGITVGIEDGSPAGQCGRFCNDVLGNKVFGDSIEQKISKLNSKVPIAGAAFVMRTDSQWGHVGMIENVNLDGSLDVVESNLYNKSNPETISRRRIAPGDPSFAAIEGYYVPPNAITEKDVILSQIRSGRMTNTDISKARQTAASEGFLAELNNELNKPENKPVTDTTASRFKSDFGLNQGGLNDLIQKRQQAGFGNDQFQGLDDKGVSELTTYREAGRKLQEINNAWQNFQDQGYSLTGILDVASRATDIENLPFTSTDENLRLFRDLTSKTGLDFAQFMKEISGAAVSEPEFERLKKVALNTEMTDTQFNDVLQTAISDYEANGQNLAVRYGFDTVKSLEDGVSKYGQMPRSISKVDEIISGGDDFFAQWGYDDVQTDVYSNNFSPVR